MAKQKKDTKPVAVEEAATERHPTFDPFGRLNLGDWFDRWPEIFARRWPETFEGVPFVGAAMRMEQFTEQDGTFVLRAELPGIDPEADVTITVANDRLTILGEREERSESDQDGGYHSEFRYGSFKRSVPLPQGADTANIAATSTDGILEVRVPVDTEHGDDVVEVSVTRRT